MDAKAILILVVKDFPTPFRALKLSNPLADAFTTQVTIYCMQYDGCRDNVLHKGVTIMDSSS
jgi:hypothetical protein